MTPPAVPVSEDANNGTESSPSSVIEGSLPPNLRPPSLAPPTDEAGGTEAEVLSQLDAARTRVAQALQVAQRGNLAAEEATEAARAALVEVKDAEVLANSAEEKVRLAQAEVERALAAKRDATKRSEDASARARGARRQAKVAVAEEEEARTLEAEAMARLEQLRAAAAAPSADKQTVGTANADDAAAPCDAITFLSSIGLEKLTAVVAKEEIDSIKTLMLLGDEEFEAMGIRIGPRVRIKKALKKLSGASTVSSANADDAAAPSDVPTVLSSLGLENLTAVFAREEIDLETLIELRNEDFDAMGIKIGPRVQIKTLTKRLSGAT